MDRSIVIILKRRAHGEEYVAHLPSDAYFATLRSRIVRWTQDNWQALQSEESSLQDTLDDRAADNWRPLIAVASAASIDWRKRALAAATYLSGTDTEDSQENGVALLRDICHAFESAGLDEMHTETLLTSLTQMPESAWATWHRGRPMTGKALATLLRSFGIRSAQLKIEGVNRNGYRRLQFAESWTRYAVASTGSTPPHNQGLEAPSQALPEATGRGYENNGNSRQLKSSEPVELQTASAPSFVLTRGGKLCSCCGGLGRVAVVDGDLICAFCLGERTPGA
jgi:hypothetical protein